MSAPYTSADATVAAMRAADISPSDATVYGQPTRSIYVGGAGSVRVDMVRGGTVTFSNVPAGTVLPIQVLRVYATGTSATAMIALY